MFAYKLKASLSIKGVHPVFHISVPNHHKPDRIMEQQQPTHKNSEVNGEGEWEVEDILNFQRQQNNPKYLVIWKGFGTKNNPWETRSNLKNCSKLINEFVYRFSNTASRHWRSRRKTCEGVAFYHALFF